MEQNTIITLAFVWFFAHQRISGTVVKMNVKPRDNVTLFCDSSIPLSYFIVWFRNCSHENQPSLLINAEHFFKGTFPRFNFEHNSSSNSYDLHIKNISVFDEGIYYCAKAEKKIGGIQSSRFEYQYGNRSTHLTVLVSGRSEMSSSTVSPPPPVSDCFLCWTLLVSVSVVCFLLCFICVYCLCQKKTTDAVTDPKEKINMPSRNSFEGDDEEVSYASLDVKTRRQKQLKKKQQQTSDFSFYAPLRTDTVQNF
ncbi:uncharacterized protein [Paramisgurnus dabryanus]|uniref:uncharacterized protein isoform X2 n=1 Tax=Paramisgurnus dabryanus TaxID=90735 RepID=UPI0031F3B01B